uniref:ORF38 n=1 Tax=Latid herpesvirus 1 TaxID=3096545 RepID=A0AB33V6K3_9VIRU
MAAWICAPCPSLYIFIRTICGGRVYETQVYETLAARAPQLTSDVSLAAVARYTAAARLETAKDEMDSDDPERPIVFQKFMYQKDIGSSIMREVDRWDLTHGLSEVRDMRNSIRAVTAKVSDIKKSNINPVDEETLSVYPSNTTYDGAPTRDSSPARHPVYNQDSTEHRGVCKGNSLWH